MGNTISEDLPSNDSWWSQTQTESTQNTNTMSSTSTIPPKTTQNTEHNPNTSTNTDSSTSTNTESSKITNIDLSTSTSTDSSTSTIPDSSTSTEVTEDLVVSINKIACESAVGFNIEENPAKKVNEEKMEQFRSELAKKHLARRQAIAERSKEILFLREELAKQKKENEDLKEQLSTQITEPENPKTEDTSWKEEADRLSEENERLKDAIEEKDEEIDKYRKVTQQNHELRMNIAEIQDELQSVNSQVISFEKERLDYQTHVSAMKEVVKVSKQLLEIRENQLQELRTKVAEIESNLAEQETSMLATNLRNEYEKQLRNMRALRTLYEQRQAATKADRDSIANELAEVTKKLEDEQTKSKEHQERIEELENDVSTKYDKVHSLESQLGFVQAERRGLQAEMSVINQLFSQILIGFNNGQVDLDRLIKLLEENHDLLTDIVINEESLEHISALPKTLLDLVNQVQEKKDSENEQLMEMEDSEEASGSDKTAETSEIENSQTEQQAMSSQMCSAAEIVHNLPKVWRVLAELLSQQSGQQPVVISEDNDGMDPCYKSIETPKGPKIVLSVSQTYIRLKDLILEKKSLEKEMTRLKQLNTHLEVRLQDQEKRLETVSTELSKTWHVVGRMQRQHQQLHTHEKILRYELAQKRKMLTELKQELEYCREKWEQAREKNSNTEEQWKKLRTEFASRKTVTADDLNNSAESGYSDDKECSSDEDSSYGPNKNKVIASPIVPKESDTEDNDETSHGSDDDLLEAAFSKACSTEALQKPQLTLSEVYVLNPETTEATSSQTLVKQMNDDSTKESVVIETSLEPNNEGATTSDELTIVNIETSTNLNCDKVENNVDSSECNSTVLHSKAIETDSTNKVQIQDETQVQQNVHNNDSLTNEENSSQSVNTEPSTSQRPEVQRTSEEILTKREERLRRLEEQCKQLVKKVTNTTNRGVDICTRLDTLHEQYSTPVGNTRTENSPQTAIENIEVTTEIVQTITENSPVPNIPVELSTNQVIAEEVPVEITNQSNTETSGLTEAELLAQNIAALENLLENNDTRQSTGSNGENNT